MDGSLGRGEGAMDMVDLRMGGNISGRGEGRIIKVVA